MDTAVTPIKQHLIDPEICIRCGTCEETCPIDAVTHNDDNYVVDAEKCNYCMDCIAPCPTGAIGRTRNSGSSRVPAAISTTGCLGHTSSMGDTRS